MVAVCRIAIRKIALTMSAPPARAMNTTASQSECARPNAATAPPHAQIATTTATPCREIRVSQPENRPTSIAPAGSAAYSQPSAGPPPGGSPKVRSAISGMSARGIPATIAMMSATNDASSTFCVAR